MDEKLNEPVTEELAAETAGLLEGVAEESAETEAEQQEKDETVEEPGMETAAEIPDAVEDNDESAGENDEDDAVEEAGIRSQLAAIQQDIAELFGFLQAMNQRFDDRIARTDFEEKSRENMFSELQAYRNDLAFNLIKPVLLEVAKVRDNILRDAARYEEKGVLPTVEEFRDYATMDLAVILEENDIELYHAEVGSRFDAKKQKVIKRIPTTEQELDRTVARSTSDGCLYKGKVLKAENVYVYTFEQGKEEENG